MDTSSLPQNSTLKKLSEQEVIKLLTRAQTLEFSRQVDVGIQWLEPLWNGLTDERPQVEGYSSPVRGEILLRCAAFMSFYSRDVELKERQEIARDWLTESIQLFTEAGISDKIAEAETELAMTYWREGRFGEAIIWLENAISKIDNDLHWVSIKNVSYQILAHFSLNTPESLQAGVALIKEKDICAELCSDARVKVHYYNNSALLMSRIGQWQEALVRHQKTINFCSEANNKFTMALAENNLGFVYKEFKQFDKALEHTEQARRLFVGLNATARIGECYDTLAQIYLEREIFRKGRDFSLAIDCIEKSLQLLAEYKSSANQQQTSAKGGNYPSYINSLQTKTRILLHQRKIPEAVMLFSELYQKAKIYLSEAAAEGYARDFCELFYCSTDSAFEEAVNEFEKSLLEKALLENSGQLGLTAEKLQLPEKTLVALLDGRHRSLKKKLEIKTKPTQSSAGAKGKVGARAKGEVLRAVKCNGFYAYIPETVDIGSMFVITEARLENVGLIEGRVAVVSKTYSAESELPIVLREILTGKIHYGFKDEAFGMIGLSTASQEVFPPLAFLPENVDFIGNIVGYCEFDFRGEIYRYFPLDLDKRINQE